MSSHCRKQVAVIGAGTVGLSVALRAAELIGNDINVTVIAAEFLSQTTSYGSGGLWEPYQIAGTPDEQVNKWGKASFDHFKQLYYSEDSSEAGVQLMTVYQIFEEHQTVEEPSWRSIVFHYTNLHQNDLSSMGLPSIYVKGYSFGTFVVDQKYYMQYLTSKLVSYGVKFVQRRLSSIEEVAVGPGEFDCVINCSGLGSATLAADVAMYPIRGQVLRVKAPWMKAVWFFGTSYVIPNVDTVVLGGTAQKGDWSTTVSLNDTKTILDNICEVFPAIRRAPVENIWVGLRPGRTPLRLECDPTGLPVIHCYGHGGSGITLAMGCADDVVQNYLAPLLNVDFKL